MSTKPKTIQHFTHNHPLTEVNVVGTYTCNGCKLYGYGKTYRCSDCDYDLHEYCATCPQTLTNTWHRPDHELSLMNGPMHMTNPVCFVCGVYIQGMFYKCKHCSFESHPLCTHGPSHPLSPGATVTKERSLHGHAVQPWLHHGQGNPYDYVHMGPYGLYPHGGHHHHHHYHQHQHMYINQDSPKVDPDLSSTSRKGKKKKEVGFGVLNAVAGEVAAALLVATVAESISNEE